MHKIQRLLFLVAAALLFTAPAFAAPTAITPQKIIRSGVVPTVGQVVDVTNGNKIYLLTDGVFIGLSNPASATDLTVTVQDQFTNAQGTSTNLTVLVARQTAAFIGPFKRARWADGNGYMQLSYTGSTTTALTVLRLPIGEIDANTK